MKRIYNLLPANVVKRIRNVLEFDGGVSDTHVFRAGPETDKYTYGPVYRPPPASQPQPRIPTGPVSRIFDIKYFPRDARRGSPSVTLPIEASLAPENQAKLLPREVELPAAIDVPVGKPIDGTFKNPDVERYDKSGLRSALTANTAAVQKELARNVGNHIPRPSWMGKEAPTMGAAGVGSKMRNSTKWALINASEGYI